MRFDPPLKRPCATRPVPQLAGRLDPSDSLQTYALTHTAASHLPYMAPTCTGMISTLRAAGSHAPDRPVLSPFKLALATMASFALLSAAAVVAVGTDMEGWTWTSLKADTEAPEKEASAGVVILSGGDGTKSICINPDATKYKGKAIAAQCCEENTCYRKTGESDDTCIVGAIKNGKPAKSFQSTTWAQASEKCAKHGYTLCDQACSGTGCGYDKVWVWTKLTCPSPPPPPATSPPPPATSSAEDPGPLRPSTATTCPAGYKLETHAQTMPVHGDLCRNEKCHPHAPGSVCDTKPLPGCTNRDQAPWAVVSGTNEPCRYTAGVGARRGGVPPFLPRDPGASDTYLLPSRHYHRLAHLTAAFVLLL